MTPRPLLHLEGAAVLIASLFAYHSTHAGWLQFALLFLLPDLSMLGYLANVRLGTASYNAIHTYLGPLALAGYSFQTAHFSLLPLCFIWIAHIGFDRMLGYGLKYPTQFKDTHLNPARHKLALGAESFPNSRVTVAPPNPRPTAL